ncbi:MAG: cobyrinic acid a,c-diamide synthase [Hyphomicrobiales bacterium]|nr:MAG: cobyrinic acid a,c-diamide synthase [Hyphomicrobiales bacterium]
MKGLLISAPQSGSGKTLVTLALLRALKNKGVDVCAAKAGPDFIDPGFHEKALGKPSVNLDPWAMKPERICELAGALDGELLIVEAMMGLFDGAADGSGSAADLATILQLPIVLVLDCARQSHSIAALVKGFNEFQQDIVIAGVILNKVGSIRHEKLLRDALDGIGVSVLGVIPRNKDLYMPERHLGLVQAGELDGFEAFCEGAAQIIAENCDLDALQRIGSEVRVPPDQPSSRIPPLGQRIAIARDAAFSFCYPHLLNDWRGAGVELSFFSPLHDEVPDLGADAVYLPGGYPELHGGTLAAADAFRGGMKKLAADGKLIYGECGGYMTLGEGLVDADGARHEMLGLLALETSFEKRKLHLGYRRVRGENFPLGANIMAHEFHYSSILCEQGEALFEVEDALGTDLGKAGLREGSVMGSYMHLIDVNDG